MSKKAIVIGVAVVGLAATAVTLRVNNSKPATASTVQADQIDTHVRNCSNGYYGLSFDDGPGGMAPQYLDALKKLNVKATFFVNGYQIADHPGNIERMVAEGHQVGNHTQNHVDLVTADATTFNSEIDTTQKTLSDLGANAALLRPPFGDTNEDIRKKIEQKNFLVAMWSVDTKDWEPAATVDSIVAKAMTVNNGGIILMHEDKQLTVDALPKVVNQLETTKGLCPGKIVKSDTEMPTDYGPTMTMNVKAVKP